METSQSLTDLVKLFKRKSLDAFTSPLPLKRRKRKKERRLLIRESEVWEMATREIREAAELLEPAEPSKRVEPGSKKYEGEFLTTAKHSWAREISEFTGIKESKVIVISILLSQGLTRREVSEAVGVSMKKLRKLFSVFPGLDC